MQMGTCSDCRFWVEHYFYDPNDRRSREDVGWRSQSLQDAGFGGCSAIEMGPREKQYDIGLDLEDATAQQAMLFGATILASLLTHRSFGCTRWKVKLGRKKKNVE